MIPRPSARVLLLLFLTPHTVAGQDAQPIRDNSFLLEEAYNQERGTFQSISNFTLPGEGQWRLTLAQEWALGSVRHQGSFTIPVVKVDGAVLGDVMLHYRYQLVGDAQSPLALAPRLSAILPTGSVDQGESSGGVGAQLAIPANWQATADLTIVGNAGVTWVPWARNSTDESASTLGYQLGASAIWSVRPVFNLLLESVWARVEEVGPGGGTTSRREFFVNPGVTFAVNGKGGWQLVPGMSYTIGVGPSAGDSAALFYLSFETSFLKGRTAPEPVIR